MSTYVVRDDRQVNSKLISGLNNFTQFSDKQYYKHSLILAINLKKKKNFLLYEY